MKDFWQDIPKPMIALAPMEEVTDTVFREIAMSLSTPGGLHILYSEFANTDGLCHPIGREKVIHRLKINDSEKKLLKKKNIKVVAQIWGAKPEKYFETTKMICEEMEFDGIDINMGCPVPKIIKQGSCSKLITNPPLAAEIIQATKEAANIPVSVKTRIGYNVPETEAWISHILEQDVSAVLIHGRTQKMMSNGSADWSEIAKAAKLRDELKKDTVIIGNGDINSLEEGRQKCEEHDLDGFMVGRGIFHNPWMFSEGIDAPTMEDRLQMLWDHALLFEETWGREKNFKQMRRFFKIYASNFKDSSFLRNALTQADDLEHVKSILNEWGFSI
jgi:nifR3 family TIM-barrel protein